MGSTAITGELIWPSQNDIYGSGVGGAVGDGVKHLETQWRNLQGSVARRNNYVISGGTLPATDVDLVIAIAAGDAVIQGHYCSWPATNITLPNNNTSYIFIKLVFSATLITGLEIEDNTSGVPPASSLQLGTAVTAAGATTGTTDTRILGPTFLQVLSSGTSYSVPAGVYRIKVRVYGASGGGGGGGEGGDSAGPANGANGGAGGNAGSTTFGALTAAGGGGGSLAQGGIGTGSLGVSGVSGDSGTASGGVVNFTGGGLVGGRGGAGGAPNGSAGAGGNGGNGSPGGYCEGWLTVSPGDTIAYTIGAAGTAGAASADTTAGAQGAAGTAGQAGRIVLEY